jgi:predicted acetyltransferase
LDRVTADIEVLKCVYSQKWGVYFVTAITDNDQSIFFSYKQDLTYGSKLSIKGTVKRQDNNQTQLNRVQVI